MSPTRHFSTLILSLLISLALVQLGQGVARAESEAMGAVRTRIANINAAAEKRSRYALTQELVEFIHDMAQPDRDAFDPEVVDDIAALLRDQDEIVRTDAALALAQIGAPALRSVGPLLRALREAKARPARPVSGFHDVDGIYAALIRLKVCIVRPEDGYMEHFCSYLIE